MVIRRRATISFMRLVLFRVHSEQWKHVYIATVMAVRELQKVEKEECLILQTQPGSLQKLMQIWLSFWNPMTKVAQSAEEEFQLTLYRSLLT